MPHGGGSGGGKPHGTPSRYGDMAPPALQRVRHALPPYAALAPTVIALSADIDGFDPLRNPPRSGLGADAVPSKFIHDVQCGAPATPTTRNFPGHQRSCHEMPGGERGRVRPGRRPVARNSDQMWEIGGMKQNRRSASGRSAAPVPAKLAVRKGEGTYRATLDTRDLRAQRARKFLREALRAPLTRPVLARAAGPCWATSTKQARRRRCQRPLLCTKLFCSVAARA